jgi:putative hydrolase of the HAD superfamily
MNSPTVLSFDLDDTLWPIAPVIAAAEAELLQWLQQRYPRAAGDHTSETMRALRVRVAEKFPEQAHDLTFLRRRALAQQFAAAGHEESLADQALEVFLTVRNRVSIFPDVRPTLALLRARYRLYALSNGNADLERCGIADLFDGHVTARAAGAAKPDPRIFARLAEEAGVAPAQVLHIGDDPLLDVLGATQSGMQAIWLNRDSRAWPPHLGAPARSVATLREIEQFLGPLAATRPDC